MAMAMALPMIMACMGVSTFHSGCQAMLMVQEHQAHCARAKDECKGSAKPTEEGSPGGFADVRYVGSQLGEGHKEEDSATSSQDGTFHYCTGVQVEREDGAKEAG